MIRARPFNAISLGLCALLGITTIACHQRSKQTGSRETAKTVNVDLVTNYGTITLALDSGRAPATVKNFLDYSKNGHYEGTIFHRVMRGFMIQGGGLTADLKQKPTGAPIKNEADNGLSNLRGTIAMARTAEIESATDQFFINLIDNSVMLDYKDKTPSGYGFCVFGKVIAGMDIVDKIAATPIKDRGGYFANTPAEAVIIQRVIVND